MLDVASIQTLAKLSMDELEEIYHRVNDEGIIAGVVIAMQLREDADNRKTRRQVQRHQVDKARWAAVYEDWQTFAHAQYLTAEEECRGNLVRKEYAGEITTGWQLWTGTEKWARERATDELREFWDANTRMTVSEFRAQRRAAKRDERESMTAE